MTPRKPSSPAVPESQERIDDIDVSQEMQDSFLEYAYSVIYSRALPDARDGLKPVQRRILFQMAEMGLLPSKGHVKSARVVGEVMGKLHPHGDTAIYDALVRLAQSWTMRLPLVDGHGNFGSLDDGPAASRYTEARLAASAIAMTEELAEEVVDLVPNYDNQLLQPEVLPSAIPNLLVNGASGIAVGMATNIPPHNLIEVVAGAKHLLANPKATVEDLMQFIPGPDLPTGGMIVGLDGIKDAYESGRGTFRTRARVSVENITARKTGLVITELPYLVGPERVIEKIRDSVNAKKIEGISDVTDLTDRKNGLKIVIGIKTGYRPEAVLEHLYRLTPLEDSFGINAVALVDRSPKTLGLKELLQVFLDHRIEVVTRRSQFRLRKRQERLHLVEGLLIAILDIDEVIQLIRDSDDSERAKQRLIEVFDLSDLQAEYILELRLRRLTKFSRIELETERDKLRKEIAELEALLASRSKIERQVAKELDAVAERFGTSRRTLLTTAAAGGSAPASSGRKAPANLEVADLPSRVLLSTTGRALRVDAVDGAEQPELITPSRRSKHDALRADILTTSRSEIGAVTNFGRLLKFSPVDLPVAPENSVQLAAGPKISDYLALSDKRERVLSIVPLDPETIIALGTSSGIVKRTLLGELPSNRSDYPLITLKDGDSVIGAAVSDDDDTLIFITAGAQLLHYSAALVRPQGRPAGGMAGMNLQARDVPIFFDSIRSNEDSVVVTVSSGAETLAGADPGRAKVSLLSEFPAKGRATGGVRAQSFLKGESGLSVAWAGPAPALASGSDGAARALPEQLLKRDASGIPLDAVISSIGYQIGS